MHRMPEHDQALTDAVAAGYARAAARLDGLLREAGILPEGYELITGNLVDPDADPFTCPHCEHHLVRVYRWSWRHPASRVLWQHCLDCRYERREDGAPISDLFSLVVHGWVAVIVAALALFLIGLEVGWW